jgi:hypothetical protein
MITAHIARDGIAIRDKDKSCSNNVVTMCGIYIDKKECLQDGEKYHWVCRNCEFVARTYIKKGWKHPSIRKEHGDI